MSFIYCRLSGGLGNQLFQFGQTLLLAKRNGVLNIKLDDDYLSSYSSVRTNELEAIFSFDKSGFHIDYESSLVGKYRLAKILGINKYTNGFISDKNYNQIKDCLCTRRCYVDGYFQDELSTEDFFEIISILKPLLTVSDELYYRDKAVVHIRGGDFLDNKKYNVIDHDYYLKSLEYLKSVEGVDQISVITDDLEHAKSVLESLEIGMKFKYNSGTMLDDFLTIKNAKYKILSNSTFSLWAGAFSSLESVTIAPKLLRLNVPRKFLLPAEVVLS